MALGQANEHVASLPGARLLGLPGALMH